MFRYIANIINQREGRAKGSFHHSNENNFKKSNERGNQLGIISPVKISPK